MSSITLYKNLSDNNVVSKKLNGVLTVNGTFRDSIDVLNPRVVIEHSTLPDFNYLYIPEFGRYYYVTDISVPRKGLIEVTGKVDVLQTYGNQIRALSGIVQKQEYDFNLYLNDGTFNVYQNPKIVTREFPNGFTSQSYVLAIAGGV